MHFAIFLRNFFCKFSKILRRPGGSAPWTTYEAGPPTLKLPPPRKFFLRTPLIIKLSYLDFDSPDFSNRNTTVSCKIVCLYLKFLWNSQNIILLLYLEVYISQEFSLNSCLLPKSLKSIIILSQICQVLPLISMVSRFKILYPTH